MKTHPLLLFYLLGKNAQRPAVELAFAPAPLRDEHWRNPNANVSQAGESAGSMCSWNLRVFEAHPRRRPALAQRGLSAGDGGPTVQYWVSVYIGSPKSIPTKTQARRPNPLQAPGWVDLFISTILKWGSNCRIYIGWPSLFLIDRYGIGMEQVSIQGAVVIRSRTDIVTCLLLRSVVIPAQ
jgi:hypothetical protein